MRLRGSVAVLVVGATVLTCGCHSTHSAVSAGSPTAQIQATWSAFFNTKTPVKQREQLLEDGPSFEQTLTAQARGGAMTAAVSKVTLSDATHAAVSFSLSIAPSTHLNSVGGAAIRVNGRWLISKSTLCVVSTATGAAPPACS
jgi:hypothetical protein